MNIFARSSIFALTAVTLTIGAAQGATYSGMDDGSGTGGPFPNSAAAQASFLSAASGFGPLKTISFEDLPSGYSANFAAAPGVSIALTGDNVGAGYSGVSANTLGSLYGFNTTQGGTKWLGFPLGTATFTFEQPTFVFGAYFSGLQSGFGSTLEVTFNNGSNQLFNVPVNVSGGAGYWGVTSEIGFSSITINRPGSDAWGIDDVTISAVPEPSAYAMLLAGLGMMGFMVRRRKQSC